MIILLSLLTINRYLYDIYEANVKYGLILLERYWERSSNIVYMFMMCIHLIMYILHMEYFIFTILRYILYVLLMCFLMLYILICICARNGHNYDRWYLPHMQYWLTVDVCVRLVILWLLLLLRYMYRSMWVTINRLYIVYI